MNLSIFCSIKRTHEPDKSKKGGQVTSSLSTIQNGLWASFIWVRPIAELPARSAKVINARVIDFVANKSRDLCHCRARHILHESYLATLLRTHKPLQLAYLLYIQKFDILHNGSWMVGADGEGIGKFLFLEIFCIWWCMEIEVTDRVLERRSLDVLNGPRWCEKRNWTVIIYLHVHIGRSAFGFFKLFGWWQGPQAIG